MSRIKKTSESIKNQLKHEDLSVSTNSDMSTNKNIDMSKDGNVSISESTHKNLRTNTKSDKVKIGFYISKETFAKLNEIYAKKLLKDKKENLSSIISRAIDLVWKEEKNHDLQ